MATKWQDKNVGAPRKWGSKKTTRVRGDSDGSHAGLQIEHWDDRMDAIVRPKTITVKPVVESVGGEKVVNTNPEEG